MLSVDLLTPEPTCPRQIVQPAEPSQRRPEAL